MSRTNQSNKNNMSNLNIYVIATENESQVSILKINNLPRPFNAIPKTINHVIKNSVKFQNNT